MIGVNHIMLKKILLGTLFGGLIGILVIGAVIRTMDKTGDRAKAFGLGEGQAGWRGAPHVEPDSDNDGRAAQAAPPIQSGQGILGHGQGGRGQRNSFARAGATFPADGAGQGQAQVEAWVTLTATVAGVSNSVLAVEMADGDQITIERRAWRFVQARGFSTEVGHEVTLVGFYDGASFEVGQISDVLTGATVLVRDDSGRPLWAGGGWRSG
jgi:hypothetical protein